ncbi:MAG: DUF4190 domain-containing protein [Verrucomicrobiia bacterium]
MNEQVPPSAPNVAPAPKTSGLALASLVLGILGVTCLLPIIGAILALILGIVALSQINKSGGSVTGQGKAIAGLVLGGVGLTLIPVIIMAALLLPALNSAREHARRAQCMSNMKAFGFAIAMYADEHDGKIPRNFDEARKFYVSDKILICPSAKDTNTPSYQILLGGKKWGSPETADVIVMTESLSNHRLGRNALYGDGHVNFVTERDRN